METMAESPLSQGVRGVVLDRTTDSGAKQTFVRKQTSDLITGRGGVAMKIGKILPA
jgi:hypothetical protein